MLDEKYEKNVIDAMAFYKNNPGNSIRTVSKRFGVARSTLQGRLQKKKSRKETYLARQRLSEDQETRVVANVKALTDKGVSVTKCQVEDIASQILSFDYDASPKDTPKSEYCCLGKSWFYRFISRHSELSYLYQGKKDDLKEHFRQLDASRPKYTPSAREKAASLSKYRRRVTLYKLSVILDEN